MVVTFAPDQVMRGALAERLGHHASITYLPEVASGDRVKALSAADAVLAWGLGRELQSRAEFEAMASAKLVQVLSAGVEGLPFELIPEGTPVASNAGGWAVPMAEHVLAMTLALAKHLPQRHADLKAGVFNRRVPNSDVRGSVVGIVGLGGVGKASAALFKALGASVHAINRSGVTDVPVDWVGTLDKLDHLLSVANILVLSVPLNRYTSRLIGRRELALMRPDAILVNVARAPIVDEDALFDHLVRNPDFSAGIDVWWEAQRNPFMTRRPFLELPNVIGSPHNSADTYTSVTRAADHAAINIVRALRGQPIEHVVNRADYSI